MRDESDPQDIAKGDTETSVQPIVKNSTRQFLTENTRIAMPSAVIGTALIWAFWHLSGELKAAVKESHALESRILRLEIETAYARQTLEDIKAGVDRLSIKIDEMRKDPK